MIYHKSRRRLHGGSTPSAARTPACDEGGTDRGLIERWKLSKYYAKGTLARGLKGVRLVTGDQCAGLVAAAGESLPGARYQRCIVHFERNILARVNPKNRDWAADALKAVFSMESRDKSSGTTHCPS